MVKKLKFVPHFWTNLRLRYDYHHGMCAVYAMVHEETGKIYIDATPSLYSTMHFHERALKDRIHPSPELQRLYNQSPRFQLHYYITGEDDASANGLLAAVELGQMWMASYLHDKRLMNPEVLFTKDHGPGVRRPLIHGDTHYANVKTAARKLKMAEKTIKSYCNDPKRPEWRWA